MVLHFTALIALEMVKESTKSISNEERVTKPQLPQILLQPTCL